MIDNVNSPSHYTQGEIEVIEVIEYITAKYPAEIRYHLGNVIKYICRAPFKGKLQEDLNKSSWYLKRAQLVLTWSPSSYTGKCKKFLENFLFKNSHIRDAQLIEIPEEPIIDKFLFQTAQSYNKEQQNYIISALMELNSSSGDVKTVLENTENYLKFITT
ncbi:hypothetical protein NGDEOPKE_00142 [Enterococcus phage vB_OCPT_Carl]|uniref:Uncharacterized protein n=1 Tax=Enterococcus phage vB_OCPT_Car TaxID=2922319 RepID=A0A9E7DUJ8_9CAUD|nr:hypothetical protein NGDEOPKE_00142 [Enterococcus phage vB_OCPT_Carl]UQT00306.1 hypothetical protein EGEOBHOM_00154 [Enterococcus phage vB_OCPT_Car]